MKRKFFLHRQNEPMMADTQVYIVWCGESVREQRYLTQLVAWAFQSGATFRQWSEDIDYYLMIESERVFPAKGILNFGFATREMTAAEALKHAMNEDWHVLENRPSSANSYFRMCEQLDRSAVDADHQRVTHRRVPTSSRENLSERIENGKFIISFI